MPRGFPICTCFISLFHILLRWLIYLCLGLTVGLPLLRTWSTST